MYKDLLEEIRGKLVPDNIWTLRPVIHEILKTEIANLPSGQHLEEMERRYPSTPSGMGIFLNDFFARHFFQIQDSILQEATFDKFYNVVQKGKVTLIQKVYDQNNSNTEQAYNYYRIVIEPKLPMKDYGVSTRFCLQNIAGI